jgi:hypothetical protein
MNEGANDEIVLHFLQESTMKYQSVLRWLILLIGVLALFAAGMGLFFQQPGQVYEYTNHRGETVIINGQGLYFYDTVSMASQQQGNDMVTLVVGLPLLILATWFAFRGSLRGQLLLAGTLGFFLYTYMSMAMLTSYNALFLVYVALFILSLYAFILSIMSINLRELPHQFSEDLPHGWISGFLFVVGGFLLLAWIGRIVPPLLRNETPVLENSTTLVIQAMDLALIVPLAILASIFLLRRSAWGYLLASVAVFKFVTMGLAVSTMTIVMALRGVPESLEIMIPFLAITVLNLVLAGLILRNVVPGEKTPNLATKTLPMHTRNCGGQEGKGEDN